MSVKRTRPRSVKVLGQKFKIKYLPPDEMEENCEGVVYTSRREIHLDNSLPLEQLRRVLIHEIMHAILSISGISEKLSYTVEESIAVAMESALPSFRVVSRVHG